MKLSEWRLKMTENVHEKLDKLRAAGDKVSVRFLNLQDNINRVKDKIRGAADEIPGLSRAISLLKNPIALLAVGVATLATMGGAATKMAFNYEEGMAKVNATALLTQEELKGLRTELMLIGKDSGGNFDRIPESFEKILSQVGEVDTSMSILRSATQGAKAGFTDLDVVSGALAQSLSVIGAENANAQDVLDTFFAAKRVGAGEFNDFATYLPTLIAAGKNLGVTYKDTAGLFAYMTGKGQEAGSAAMLIQNAFTALGKGEIVKGLKSIGVSVFDKDGSMRDMGVIMGELGNKLGTLSNEQKSKVLEGIGLRDVQAKNAFAILMSDSAKLNEALASTNNALGETKAAMDNTGGPARTWAEVMDKVKFIMTDIGYKILPYVATALEWVSGALDWFTTNGPIIVDVLGGIWNGLKVLLIIFSPLLLVMGAMTVAIWAQNAAWLANPLVWIAIAVIGVVTAITLLWNRSEKFRGFLYGLWGSFKEVFAAIWDIAKNILGGIGEMLVGIFTGNTEKIKGGLESLGKGLVAGNPVGFIYQYGKKIGGAFEEGNAEGQAEVRARNQLHTDKQMPNSILLPGMVGPLAHAAGAGDEKKKSAGDEKITAGLNNISGGGSQARNITITIGKLQEKTELHVQQLQEGLDQAEEKLMRMLVRVIQGSETAIANQ